MAFGGFKQSGLGREYGQEPIDAYTQVKSVWARLWAVRLRNDHIATTPER